MLDDLRRGVAGALALAAAKQSMGLARAAMSQGRV